MVNNYKVTDESKQFAFMIIDLYKYLIGKQEFVISKQILRSWTSIWANISESKYWSSKKDFLYKMTIALKEIAETKYWIDLLEYWWYLKNYERKKEINEKTLELLKVITKIVKTTKENMQK